MGVYVCVCLSVFGVHFRMGANGSTPSERRNGTTVDASHGSVETSSSGIDDSGRDHMHLNSPSPGMMFDPSISKSNSLVLLVLLNGFFV